MLNQWEALKVYISHGYLNIDKNAAERALKRVALGRKNWLFAGPGRTIHPDVGSRAAAACGRNQMGNQKVLGYEPALGAGVRRAESGTDRRTESDHGTGGRVSRACEVMRPSPHGSGIITSR